VPRIRRTRDNHSPVAETSAPAPVDAHRWLQALSLGVIAGYLVTVIPGVRATPGYSMWLDGVWQPLAFVSAAVICAARNRNTAPDRSGWWWVAVALLFEAAAETVWAWWIRPITPEPYPSWADALWLSFYAAMLVAVFLITWIRVADISLRLVLDAILIGLGIASVAVASLLPGIRASGAGRAEAVINLAYPIFDITLMACVCAAIALFRLRPPPGLWFLAGGMMLWSIADSVYLFQSADSSYSSGGWIDATWVVAATCVALGPGWSRNPTRPAMTHWSAIVAPVAAALLALSVIVVRDLYPIGLPAKYLAVATILVALARLAMAYRDAHHEQHNARLARIDELTGIWNRRGFNEIAHRLCTPSGTPGEPHTTVAFLLLDIDGFKTINDSLGHHAGDQALQTIAARLEAAVRDGDYVARIGGDEFVVILTGGVSTRIANRIATHLTHQIRQPIVLDGHTEHLNASIGIAMAPRDGHNPSTVLRAADKALYKAKPSNRAGLR
jgi:diguanylate cyclase (GGDEF)-like protein